MRRETYTNKGGLTLTAGPEICHVAWVPVKGQIHRGREDPMKGNPDPGRVRTLDNPHGRCEAPGGEDEAKKSVGSLLSHGGVN